MAIVTTPLGLQKPDGGEAVRNGDNVLAANAQKVEDLIQADRGRLGTVESTTAAQNIRLAAVEAAAFVGGGLLMEDPTDPGFFLVGA